MVSRMIVGATQLVGGWRALVVALALFQAVPPAPPPTRAEDPVRVIQALYAQRRFQEAAKLGEKLVKERRDDPDAWMALALVHLAPDWPFRRDARAESAAERALKLAGHRPDVVAACAMARYRQTKYDEALAFIAELVDADPPKLAGDALSDLLETRADVLLKRDALDAAAKEKALHDLERALAATPQAATPRAMRADVAMQDGRFADALDDLLIAQVNQPGSRQVHHELHLCLGRLGKKEEARHHYEIWKRLNRLTESTSLTNAPDPEERLQLLRELRDLNPNDLDHRFDLAQVALEAGQPDAAIQECDSLLKINPGWPPAQWLLQQAKKMKQGESEGER